MVGPTLAVSVGEIPRCVRVALTMSRALTMIVEKTKRSEWWIRNDRTSVITLSPKRRNQGRLRRLKPPKMPSEKQQKLFLKNEGLLHLRLDP
jgi:hypothetical protein